MNNRFDYVNNAKAPAVTVRLGPGSSANFDTFQAFQEWAEKVGAELPGGISLVRGGEYASTLDGITIQIEVRS